MPWLYLMWGVAHLVGYVLLWWAWSGGNPWFQVPGAVAGIGFAVLVSVSIAASVVISTRINRGVRGVSDFAGRVDGFSWSICGFAFFVLSVGLAVNGASPELISIYFPSASGLMVGSLYLGGAALWRDRGQLEIGVVLIAVSSVAPFVGQPANNLVMALGGGGVFLIASVVSWVRLPRVAALHG